MGQISLIVGKWDWSINDIIVLTSVVVFVFVVSACSIMWATRPLLKKDAGDISVNRLRSNWQANHLENAGGGTANTSSKSKGSKEKKKGSKKDKSGKIDLEEGKNGSRDSSHPSLEEESLLGLHASGSSSSIISASIADMCRNHWKMTHLYCLF